MISVYWIRNDLRIKDNFTLYKFCQSTSDGLIIWCPTKSVLCASKNRKSFIFESLNTLNEDLSKFDQKLICSPFSIIESLKIITHETQILKIYFTEDYAFDEVQEQQQVLNFCKSHTIEVHTFDQNTLVEESQLPFKIDNMPFVFTVFRKKIEANLNVTKPISVPPKWPKLFENKNILNSFSFLKFQNLLYSDLKTSSVYPFSKYIVAGETAGLDRIQDYFSRSHAVRTYKDTRNGMMDWNDSSKFSIWLNQGSISARTIYDELKKYEQLYGANESTYWIVFELFWRDYFKFFSKKYKNKIFLINGVQSDIQNIPRNYQKNPHAFQLWCEGRTTCPFVNANMIELNLTGWMSNRGRQYVASFLIHHLNLPWTWGAKYFEKKLIDYDPDLNWGNWLYLSGQGSDPRSRVFNTQKQSEMYDPQKTYQNFWLSQTL